MRASRKNAGEGHQLLFASREGEDALVLQPLEAALAQELTNPFAALLAVERGSLNGRGAAQAQVNIFCDGGHDELRLRLGEEHPHALESALRADTVGAAARRL